MQDNQINTLSEGMDFDSAYVSFPPNRYSKANDVEFVSDNENQRTLAQAKLGTTLQFTVPKTEALKQIWRVQHYCDTDSQTRNPDLLDKSFYQLKFIDNQGNIVVSTVIEFTPLNYRIFDNFKSSLESVLLAEGVDATVDIIGDPLLNKYATVTINSYAPLPQFIDSIQITTVDTFENGFYGETNALLLQDEYEANIELEPIAYVNQQNIGFVLSVSADKKFTEIGSVNEYNNFEYTRHLRTKSFVLNDQHPIDISVEQQNDGVYSLYFVNNSLKPKCIYIPTLSQDSCLRFSPLSYQTSSKGSYNLSNTNEQTNAQLINNIVHCEYKETIESGGNLTTGGKAYAVRCGINDAAKTEWSVISKTVPVIAQNSQSKLSWVAIEGTPVGMPTSKMNVITIKNANPNVFTFCEVAVIEYTADNVGTPYIIGKYDITSDSFDIIHNGNENYVAEPIEAFVNTEPVILTAKNQEIKRQRINYSNVAIGANEEIFSQIAENAVLGTARFEVKNTGKLADDNGNQRFLGTKIYDSSNRLLGTTNNAKQVISLSSVPISGITPSPYDPVTSAYTVTPSDVPNMQFVLKGKGTVYLKNGVNFFNLYFVIFRNDEEVGSILLGDRNNIPSDFTGLTDPSDYIIDVNKVINITVVNGDVLKFKIQLHASNGQDTYFETNSGGFVLNINRGSSQDALQFTNTQVGEYQIPFNVANRSGYMLNDYRFVYARFHLKNGFTTSAIPLGQYSENGGLDVVKGLHKTSISSPNSIFTDNNTTSDRKVYNYAISVSNLDITSIRNQLSGISFWVSDDIGSIIGTGIYAIAENIDGDTYAPNFSGAVPPTSIKRNFGVFLSHDTINKDIQAAFLDKIKTFGEPMYMTENNNFKSGINFTSKIREYLGYIPTPNFPAFSFLNIEDAKPTAFNSTSDIIYNQTENNALKLSTSTNKKATINAQGIAITTTQKSNNLGGGLSNLIQLAQYQRSVNILNLNYKNYNPKFTGTLIKIDNSIPNVINNLSVYGGDTYTQKTIRKVTYWKEVKVGDNTNIESSFITYYAQNRVNAQLFYTNKQADTKTYNLSGSKSIYSYLFPFSVISDLVEEQFNYEKSYLAQTNIQNADVYDFNQSYPSLLNTRTYFSDPKPVGSFYDAYRKIRAINFMDLEQKNGGIVGMFSVGERMVFIQPNLVCSVPYDTETLLNNSQAINIYVGMGGVYGRKAEPISLFGATLKSATLKGYNTNGNSQVYWLSKDFKNINRYDYSGAKILTDQNSMRTFFNHNVQFIRNEFDVNLVYDINKTDIIITARACKPYPFWEIGFPYNEGDYVTFVANGYKEPNNFENNPTIYRATNNVTSTLNPILDPNNWEFISYADINFYNHWSLIFNESKDYFTTFYTPLQKRYFNHNKRVFSPRGISPFGAVYEINNGETLKFYDDNGDFKQGRFELEVIASKGLGLKRFTTTMLENGTNDIIDATIVNTVDNLESSANEWEKRGTETFYPIQPANLDDSLQGSWLKTNISSLGNIVVRTITNFWNKVF